MILRKQKKILFNILNKEVVSFTEDCDHINKLYELCEIQGMEIQDLKLKTQCLEQGLNDLQTNFRQLQNTVYEVDDYMP